MKTLNQKRKEFLNALRVGWFLAVRQIKRSNKGTTGLIIFIMILTFLNLVVVSGLLVGLIAGSFEQYREGYSGEVYISSADGHDFIENSQGLISYLEHHPRVKSFSPRHTAAAQILGTLTDLPNKDERPNSIGTRLNGIDPMKEEEVTGFSKNIWRGKNLNPSEEGYIVIGANIIKKYSNFADANIPGLSFLEDVDVGSRVRVTITRESGAVSKDFIVKGIAKAKIDEVSTRAFILDKELKRMLPVNKEELQEISVRTDYEYAPILVRELKDFMGSNEALIQTSDEAIPSFLRDVAATMNVLGNALSSIALVVASITVFIVIFINAVTKRKFIGIMKGIGISPAAIKISYVMQAIFYGSLGSIFGLLLTFGVLKPYFLAHPIDFPFSDGILVATWFGSLIRVSILLVVTFAAGYIPARIIVRKNTLDSILGR